MAPVHLSTRTVPPVLRPLCRAYVLGHLSTTGPRLIGFLRVVIRKDIGLEQKLRLLHTILSTSVQFTRFPTVGAIIVGGATALPRLVQAILQWLLTSFKGKTAATLGPIALNRIRYLCSFLSAWLAFDLLNTDKQWSRNRARSIELEQEQISRLDYPNQHHPPPPASKLQYAGKTMDFTLGAFCRACDILVMKLCSSPRVNPHLSSGRIAALLNRIRWLGDPFVFSTSVAVVMWSWFYAPERLPKAYNKWIGTAADVDPRQMQALRGARRGDFIYGQNTGQANLLGSLCRELQLPEVLGDPEKTIPIPCVVSHCGTGPSCEYHAISRFVRSWIFAMKLYLPIQILAHIVPFITIIKRKSLLTSPSQRQRLTKLILRVLKSSSRSSSFLATIIMLFYYSVCLARTRLGPLLFPSVSPQSWDSGLHVLSGCLTCGWGILIEKPTSRAENAQFVAPRALATLLPRVYDRKEIWKEKLVFATSVAVVMGTVVSRERGVVRGVLGKALRQVISEK